MIMPASGYIPTATHVASEANEHRNLEEPMRSTGHPHFHGPFQGIDRQTAPPMPFVAHMAQGDLREREDRHRASRQTAISKPDRDPSLWIPVPRRGHGAREAPVQPSHICIGLRAVLDFDF